MTQQSWQHGGVVGRARKGITWKTGGTATLKDGEGTGRAGYGSFQKKSNNKADV